MTEMLAMREESSTAAVSRAVADLAGRQHGVIAARQLAALGCRPAAISRWVASGRLHRLHQGVYVVGHRVLSADGRRLAAALACGRDALVSHQSAAALWGLRQHHVATVHVTVGFDRGNRSRPGIRVHHTRSIDSEDRAVQRTIPVTSVARTLVDLGDVAPPVYVRTAFVAAERRELIDMTQIDRALRRAGPRRGSRVLRELLRAYDPRWSQTRSGLELALLDVLAEHGLPPAQVNCWIDGRFVADFLWRDQRLIAETDSAAFHTTPSARRSDARRDAELRRLGYRVVRISDEDLLMRPLDVASRLRAALAARTTADEPQTAPTSARPS